MHSSGNAAPTPSTSPSPYGPSDIDLLEQTLPTLQKTNAPAARTLLQRALDRLTPIVEDFPEATQYKSQLTRLQNLQSP